MSPRSGQSGLGKKYAKDLKPGYTIAGEKVMEKVTPSPVVEEKSEASDGFTEETKTTVTNTTGKNQAQEESFAGSVTRGIQKASLDNKISSGDCSIGNWFCSSFL